MASLPQQPEDIQDMAQVMALVVLLSGLTNIMGMSLFCLNRHGRYVKDWGVFLEIGRQSILIVSSLVYWINIGVEAGPGRSCLLSVFCGAITFIIRDATIRGLGRSSFSPFPAYTLHMFLVSHTSFHLELLTWWCTYAVRFIAWLMSALRAC